MAKAKMSKAKAETVPPVAAGTAKPPKVPRAAKGGGKGAKGKRGC